ncbi:MAG: nucleotidyltransferase family protein [Armatimonadota bacterium]
MIDAVVLAGGELERERFQGLTAAVDAKAEIPILGRPMVEWTVRALRETGAVDRIVVVGPASLSAGELRALGVDLIPERGGLAPNVRTGLEALSGSPRVLVLSADLPLVSREALLDLLEHAPEADVVFPVVERAEAERRFGDREWIYARTADGEFTGSALGLVRPGAVLRRWEWAERLLDARRLSPLRLAMMVGPLIAFKYLFGALRIRDVEQRLSRILKVGGRAYRSRYPELAMDVDKLSDLAFVERELRRRGTEKSGTPAGGDRTSGP